MKTIHNFHFNAAMRRSPADKVTFFADAVKIKKASYFTDCKADAIGTAKLELSKLSETNTCRIDYDLLIDANGMDMGITPIARINGNWEMCDVCYELYNYLGETGEEENGKYQWLMESIMDAINKGGHSGFIGNINWRICPTV